MMNKAGVVSSYYVEKDRLITLAGFLRLNTSGSLVSMGTTGFKIDGKPGTWLACDDTIVDGKQFFLMQNEQMKKLCRLCHRKRCRQNSCERGRKV